MLLSPRLPLPSLIELCRVGRHYLGSGLTLRDVFRQQARRGPSALRPAAGRISAALERGDTLEEAIKREGTLFPPLVVSLVGVGEETGMLPEVFGELERYFVRQRQLRQQFLSRIAWPAIQFFLAVLVLAGLIFVMGFIAEMHGSGTQAFDPLGLGLSGAGGALIFLGVIFGTLLAGWGVYLLLTRGLRQKPAVDRFLLGLPALGPCLRALALGRFCLALRLTTETGMSIARALRLSFRATGNSAFAEGSAAAEAAVKEGEDLTLALVRTGLFPEDFQRIIAVAEESGQLHEVLKHQADHYHEEASRRLAVLTSLAGYAVWLTVAVFIIVAIFRIFSWYLNLLNSV
jgi:type IV pilus assembly protein PilC